MRNVIVFDAEAKKDVLDILGKALNSDGYIVEKDDPSLNVLSDDGQPLTLKDFAGVRKGSEIYIKSDFDSLIDVADLIS